MDEPFPEDRARDRRRLLDAVLAEVPFEGWTPTALARAAEACGFAAVEAEILFPDGPIDAVAYWSRVADEAMLQAMEARDAAAMKVRERVATAIRLRLEAALPHRDALARAVALLAMPANAALGARLWHETVDTIWYAAGDRSADFNWYTKRGLLAPVYAATVLYWLQDQSEDHAKTWAFLDRRLADVLKLGKAIQPAKRALDGLAGLFARRRRVRTGPEDATPPADAAA